MSNSSQGRVIRTPDQRLRVFVSSTLQELIEERVGAREAITALRLSPVMSLAWLWGILLVGATVLLAVAGTVLARRWVSVEILKLNNEVAGFIYGVIGVLYAVLLGFTAIIVWERFDTAQAGVDQEANELADLYRDAQAFPDDTRKQLESQLRAYAGSWWRRNGRPWPSGRQVLKPGKRTTSFGEPTSGSSHRMITKGSGMRSRSRG